jgi:hypothetical protein
MVATGKHHPDGKHVPDGNHHHVVQDERSHADVLVNDNTDKNLANYQTVDGRNQ